MSYIFDHDKWLTANEISDLARSHTRVSLSNATLERVASSRRTLEDLVRADRVIYGVNTSLGGFVNCLVPTEKARQLQENLINAVSTNVGPHLDSCSVRSIMLARIKSLSRGYSAISTENLMKLLAVYNSELVPCIPQKGSLGTSGDLGPLAAIALVCCGQWKARLGSKVMPGLEALHACGLEPMNLSYKEGLALINGTSGMTGLGCQIVADAWQLFNKYLTISALSIEGLGGIKKPFNPIVHKLKPHLGQMAVAERIFSLITPSKLAVDESVVESRMASKMDGGVHMTDHHIEDAYSIRCTPQILGPVMENIQFVQKIVENELNSSNDNPLILPDSEEIYHNGHFHGQYVAMAMDFLSIGMTTQCNLANRRIDRFLDKSNSNGLPPFLCRENAGLRLGLMGGQFMTASITAETRTLCVPQSVQSLSSTADFQDIVSFGFTAARRCREIIGNVKYVIAFELVCACQAIDIRGRAGMSELTKPLYEKVREIIPYLDRDVVITDYIEKIVSDLLGGNFNE